MGWVRPLLIAGLLAQAAIVAAAVSAPYRPVATMTVAPGVVHERGTMTTTTAGRQAVYIARADLSQPVLRIEASISNDRIVGLEPTTQQANRKNREGHRAVAAINGDFFDPNQAPFGIHIQDGELIAYGPKPRPSFGVTADRKVLIEPAGITGSVCRPDGVCAPIARVNQARTLGEGAGELVLYTNRFGDNTGTDDSGTEVLLGNVSLPLPTHGSFDGIVRRVRTHGGSMPLGAADVVLSGAGTGAKFLDLLPDGARLAITFSTTQGWDTVIQAVSGPTMLVRAGAAAIDPYSHGYADVTHPRSGVGITAKGEVLLFAIDGRQPGYSMGVTLDELAELMVSQGVVNGISLDSGGSTTLGVRLPGTDGLTMVNRGSDGFERAVGNSLVLYSTAPTGPLAMLAIRPETATVLSGSHIDYTALGEDASYNPVRLPHAPRWESTVGSIDVYGRFIAGGQGDGMVKAFVDQATGSTGVSVVPTLASLEIAPDPVIVMSGATQSFTLTGHDAQGRSVAIDPAAAEWRASPVLGKMTGGQLKASSGGRGVVAAAVGVTTASARVEIGKPPVIVDDFEDANDKKISATHAAANLSRAVRGDPVRRGTSSLRLTYDMRNQTGISAAGVKWEPARPIESRPLRIGVWVWGDGSRHDLRGNYRDRTGALKIVNFTSTPGPLLTSCTRRHGGIDWIGWKYIDFLVPRDAVPPLKWERIYIVESNDRCDNASSIYLDDLRAVYLDAPEDNTGPLITNLVPSPGAVIENGKPEIGASVKDESGVEPSSIRLLVDGVQIPATFEVTSGRARYTPVKPLDPGNHRVHLEAEDRAGNPAQPFAEWGFTVK
ncbi:MAG TPA: phosphodiester glycosidase family protein [Thermoanaerobaculia bacterium]|nr:phosphodiester glycosidase family protein [Thermoanaerobaculia bacterium]